MKHTITVMIEKRFGALDRVATLFSGKGFSIHSITIGETEFEDIARMTIVTSGDDEVTEQVVKQLNKLIDTIGVADLTRENRVERELALISVDCTSSNKAEVKDICKIFRGNIVDINNTSMTIEVTGPPDKIDALVNVLLPLGIKEVARTGTVALKRGEQQIIRKKYA